MKRLGIVVSIIAILVLSFACGGSEKSARAFSDAELAAIVSPVPQNLSFQVALQSDAAITNEEAARTFTDSKKWLDNYERWGRSGGHTASFGAAGLRDASLQAQVEAYATVEGATEALSGVRDVMTSGEALATYSRLGYTDANIEVIDAAQVGDDSTAYLLTVTLEGTRFDTLVLIFRRGPVIGQASVGAQPDTGNTSDVEAIASQMDGRIQAYLSGG